MKIALFGGRFDPPHKGHMSVANAALTSNLDIDEMWLMPTPHHHWKPSEASPEDRLAMVSLLADRKIRVSDFDIRHDYTYAIDTIKHLQHETTNAYVWVAGADIVPEFSRWKEYQELQKKIPFLIIPRNPYEILDLPEHFSLLKNTTFIPTAYSSTEIRERIRHGLPIDDMVPRKVIDYIYEKKLYK